MPDDPHVSAAAKVAALVIVTRLQERYGLPQLDPADLQEIAEEIERAIKDGGALSRILRDADLIR